MSSLTRRAAPQKPPLGDDALYAKKADALGDSRGYRALSTGELGSAVKNGTCRLGPRFGLLRPAILLAKIGVCAASFDFPRTSEIRDKSPLPRSGYGQMPSVNSPLNTKTAFRRFPRTKPDIPSQGLIMPITLRDNLQGGQSNTAKLSNQFLIPSSVSHSSRQSCRSSGHRLEPYRPVPLPAGNLTRTSIDKKGFAIIGDP